MSIRCHRHLIVGGLLLVCAGGSAWASPDSAPQPPASPTLSDELEWKSVTLMLTDGGVTHFTIDREGNFSHSSTHVTGKLTEVDTRKLQVSVNVVQNSAGEQNQCARYVANVNGAVILDFGVDGSALFYHSNANIDEQCWMGDREAVSKLNALLTKFQSTYLFGQE